MSSQHHRHTGSENEGTAETRFSHINQSSTYCSRLIEEKKTCSVCHSSLLSFSHFLKCNYGLNVRTLNLSHNSVTKNSSLYLKLYSLNDV